MQTASLAFRNYPSFRYLHPLCLSRSWEYGAERQRRHMSFIGSVGCGRPLFNRAELIRSCWQSCLEVVPLTVRCIGQDRARKSRHGLTPLRAQPSGDAPFILSPQFSAFPSLPCCPTPPATGCSDLAICGGQSAGGADLYAVGVLLASGFAHGLVRERGHPASKAPVGKTQSGHTRLAACRPGYTGRRARTCWGHTRRAGCSYPRAGCAESF